MSTPERQTPGALGHRAVLRTFTPEQACALLEKNETRDFQRSVNQTLVMRIAEDLRRGRWVVNGETIIIDKTGRVVDGQHRLWGCFESGKPVTTWVIEGVEPEAFKTIDTGRCRTASDMIGIVTKFPGMPTKLSMMAQNGAARAIRLLLTMDKSGRFINFKSARRPTNTDVAKFAQDNPSILDDSKTFASFGKWPIPMGMCLAVHFATKKAFDTGVHDFWHPLQSGIGILDETSPLALLREKAVRHPRQSDFMRDNDIFAQVIKAWNGYGVGKKMKALRYVADVEAFPSVCIEPGVEPRHIADTRVGRPLTVEHKRNMSESQKRYNQMKKLNGGTAAA